jgi:hypothetical protein
VRPPAPERPPRWAPSRAGIINVYQYGNETLGFGGGRLPHPQGYLWLEVAKGDAYLNFGCGTRANRATDQVATWWFITSRRIGLDLYLVEGRVPVSRDALRILIEPDSLFGQLCARGAASLADRALEGARISREFRRGEEKARANYDDALGRRGAAETRKRELEPSGKLGR